VPRSRSAPNAARLLVTLQDEIRSSHLARGLRARLLTIVSDAASELDHGQNVHARAVLEQQLVPLLKRSSSSHAVARRQATRWVAAAKRILSAIPPHDAKLGANGFGQVSVFNCFEEPVSGLTVAGGPAGSIPGWSLRGAETRYTPAGLPVWRSNVPNRGEFAMGDNALTLPWDSFTGAATITIPETPLRTARRGPDPVRLHQPSNAPLHHPQHRACDVSRRRSVTDSWDPRFCHANRRAGVTG